MEQLISRFDSCKTETKGNADNHFENNVKNVEVNQSAIKVRENLLSLLKRWEQIENESNKSMTQLRNDFQAEIQVLKKKENKMNEISSKSKQQICNFDSPDPYYSIASPGDYYYKINNINQILTEGNWEHISNEFALKFFPLTAKIHLKATKTSLHFQTYFMEMNDLCQIIKSKKIFKINYSVISQNERLAQLSKVKTHKLELHKNLKIGKVVDEATYKKESLFEPGYIVDDALKICFDVTPPAEYHHNASHDGFILFSIYNVKHKRESDFGSWSPYFYTSPFGHLVYAHIWMKGSDSFYGNGITIRIVIDNNNFETKLLEPSQYQITVTLYNPNDFSKFTVKTQRARAKWLHKTLKFDVCENEIIDNLVDNDQLVCRITIDELFMKQSDSKYK